FLRAAAIVHVMVDQFSRAVAIFHAMAHRLSRAVAIGHVMVIDFRVSQRHPQSLSIFYCE
ncbi:MAG: hypothetical protein V3T72_20090, partial [Thermoanaerobaculia bacterium]